MDMDILCTQAMVDDENDEPGEDVENNDVQVATLKVLPCRKTGIPSMEFPIHIGENVIGRHTNCQISIPWSVSLSKKHAIIEAERDSCSLLDCGSSNKSRLGKMKLKPTVRYGLRNGDEIQFADVKCLFVQDNDTTTDDELLSIVEETPVKPFKKAMKYNGTPSSSTPCSKLHILAADTPDNLVGTSSLRIENLDVSTVPDSQEVGETPATKPMKIFPSKNSPLICELSETLSDEDITGSVESNNNNVKNNQQEKKKHESDKIGYHMDSDTDIEDDHAIEMGKIDNKGDEDVYSAETLPLDTENDNSCSSPIISISAATKKTSGMLIVESDEEDLDEMSLLLNLDPIQTQPFSEISSKKMANQMSRQQKINNAIEMDEKSQSKSKNTNNCEEEKAGSSHTDSSFIIPTAADDTFDDMCTQAFTNVPMKSTNEAKRTECHDTLDILETQGYFVVQQAIEKDKSEEKEEETDADHDVSILDEDDCFNMPTPAFCQSPKVSPARNGTHHEEKQTLPDITLDSEGTLYGSQYTDTEPMIVPESSEISACKIASPGRPALLRSSDCIVPFSTYSSITKTANCDSYKNESSTINNGITAQSSCEGSKGDSSDFNEISTSGKRDVGSDNSDDDTQVYSLSAVSTHISSSQDSNTTKNIASDSLLTENVKSKCANDDTVLSQGSVKSDTTQQYSVTESLLNSEHFSVITEKTVSQSFNPDSNSDSKAGNVEELSEKLASDVLSSSSEVKLGIEVISENLDAKESLTNMKSKDFLPVSSENNLPEESAVFSNNCHILPAQDHTITSMICKTSNIENEDEPTSEAHIPCGENSKVTLDNDAKKMDYVQSNVPEPDITNDKPEVTNGMKDVQSEKSTFTSISNIDESKCFPAAPPEVKSLEECPKYIVDQDVLCTQSYITTPRSTMLKLSSNEDVHNGETMVENANTDLKSCDSAVVNKGIGKEQFFYATLPSTSNSLTTVAKFSEVPSSFGEDDHCTQAYISVSTDKATGERNRDFSKRVLRTDGRVYSESTGGSTELDDLCTQAYITPGPTTNDHFVKQRVQSGTPFNIVGNISIKSENPMPVSSEQDILPTQSYITSPGMSSGRISVVANNPLRDNEQRSEDTLVQKSSNGSADKIKSGRLHKTYETVTLSTEPSVVTDKNNVEPPPRRSSRISKRKSDQMKTDSTEEETTAVKHVGSSVRSTRSRKLCRPTINNEEEQNSKTLASTEEVKVTPEEKPTVTVKKNTRGRRRRNTAATAKAKTFLPEQVSSCTETESNSTQKIKTELPDMEFVSSEISSSSVLAKDVNSLQGQTGTPLSEASLSGSSIASTSSRTRLKKEGSKKRRTGSVSSVSSSCSNVSTKPMRKKVKAEQDVEDFHAASLALRPRRAKPKVMFTGVTDAVGEAIVKELGGKMVQDITESTHLITDKIRRTIKFLCAVSRGIYILSPRWLHMSKEHGRFLPEEDFYLKEDSLTPDSGNLQTKFKFQLHNSLELARSKTLKLFHGLSVFVTRNVVPPPDQMHQIIRCAGGEVLKKMPTAIILGAHPPVVIAAEHDERACMKAVKGGCYVVNNEFILTGILRQDLDFDSFALFGSCSEARKNNPTSEAVSADDAKEETEAVCDSLKENCTPDTSSSSTSKVNQKGATRTSKRKTRKKNAVK